MKERKIIIFYTLILIIIAMFIKNYFSIINKEYFNFLKSQASISNVSNDYILFQESTFSENTTSMKNALVDVLIKKDKKINFVDLEYLKVKLKMSNLQIKELLNKYNVKNLPSIVKVDKNGNSVENLKYIKDRDDLKYKLDSFIDCKNYLVLFNYKEIIFLISLITIFMLVVLFVYNDKSLCLKFIIVTSAFLFCSLCIFFSNQIKLIDLNFLSGEPIVFYIYITNIILSLICMYYCAFKILLRKIKLLINY